MRRSSLQEQRAEARSVRVDMNVTSAFRSYGDLFQALDDLICAKRMMGDEVFLSGVQSAESAIKLARGHVGAGFPLPPTVVDHLRMWATTETVSDVQDREWWVMELLKVAVGGLDRSFNLQAWGLIETWTRDQTLPLERLRLAEAILSMARNDR